MSPLKSAVILCTWLLGFIGVAAFVSPVMLDTGNPSLTMLAFTVPVIWLLAGIGLLIAWAETGWRNEWEQQA